ncbi:MAG: Stk1 family PASTA domain-containing Ser/Thr kinase [Candidatus Velthaea sp.]
MIGRYRLDERLGEGASATVWCGHDTLLGRNAAIKILKPAVAADPVVLERFYAEARAVAGLSDPRIAQIYDVHSDGKMHALVMELVEGPSLAAILRAEGRIDAARAVRYVRGVAQALGVAHANGIIHRDIKPANILTDRADEVKVVDFGIAKAFTDADGGLTQHGAGLIGSVSYMSPEQAQGLTLTPASDLYSLGVVLHQLLTGELPFRAKSVISVAVAHATEPAPSEATLARAMPAALASIVHRLLAKDPAARFASAASLDRALENARISGDRAENPVWDQPTMMGIPVTPVVPPVRPVQPPPRQAQRAPSRPLPTLALAFAAGWFMRFRPRARAFIRTVGADFRTSGTQLRAAILRLPAERRRAASIAIAGVLLMIALIWAGQPRAIAVPDLARVPLARAQATLTAAGLTSTIVRRSSDTVATGAIVAQQPGARSQLHRGDAVALTVSTGPAVVTIPNLMGTEYRAANAALVRLGLHGLFAARFSNAPANSVVDQRPAAGARVKPGSTDFVVISTGPMPNVRTTSDEP